MKTFTDTDLQFTRKTLTGKSATYEYEALHFDVGSEYRMHSSDSIHTTLQKPLGESRQCVPQFTPL